MTSTSAGRTALPTAGPGAWPVLIALGTVYLVWGSTYLAIKYTVAGLPPLLSMGTRFLTAGALLLVGVLALRGRRAVRATRQQVLTAASCGVLLLLGGNGLVAVAEQDVASGLAALLVAGTPLWVVVFRALLRDRPPVATVAGLVLGLVGVAILLLPGSSGASGLGPALLVILASALWAAGTVVATRRPLPPDPFVTTIVEMAAGGTAMLLVGSAGGEWGRLDLAAVATSSWVAFGYLIVFGSLVAFSSYVWLLAHVPVALVTTYAYVNPAVAVGLGALFLAEPLTVNVLVGGGVIIAAVAVVVAVEGRARRSPVPDRPQGAVPVEPT